METGVENKNKLRYVIPGEEVAREKNGFMAYEYYFYSEYNMIEV